MKHIGRLIEQEMERQERNPTWLAKKIPCVRTNVYYLLKQESLQADMIERLSIALNHDFFKDLSEDLTLRLPETVKNFDGNVQ